MQIAPKGCGRPGESVGLLASDTFTLHNRAWVAGAASLTGHLCSEAF